MSKRVSVRWAVVAAVAGAMAVDGPAWGPARVGAEVAAVQAGAGAGDTELKLREVAWQLLPASVGQVVAGPDGRVWAVTRPAAAGAGAAGAAVKPAELKAAVEKAFAARVPVVPGWRPVLFEAGGRVWFTDGRMLLGYDGTAWVEREVEAGRLFTGSAPGNARFGMGSTVNRQAGGASFFADNAGVHVFDGKAWTYQLTAEDPAAVGGPGLSPIDRGVMLLVEGDGKGLVAVRPGAKGAAWRWRSGAWTKLALPEPAVNADGGMQPVLAWAATAPGGRLLLADSAGAVRDVRYEEVAKEPSAAFVALVAKLSSDDGDVRDRATGALLSMGNAVAPWVKSTLDALGEAGPAETRARLAGVLETLAGDTDASILRLGNYRVKDVAVLHQEGDGTLFVGTQSILEADKDLGPGVLLVTPEGAARRLGGKSLLAGVTWSSQIDGAGPLAWTPGKGFWAGGALGGGGPVYVDVSAGGTEATLTPFAEEGFPFIQAIGKDGTVFASVRDPSMPSDVPIVAVRRGAPEDRTILAATAIEVRSPAWCVASDGAIWADRADGLSRYEGGAWKVMREPPAAGEAAGGPPDGIAMTLLPTSDGRVLVRFTSGRLVLVGKDGKAVEGSGLLEKFVEANRAEFATAFAGVLNPGGGWGAGTDLAADRAGNVYVLDGQKLKVLTNAGAWLEDVAAAGGAAGGGAAAGGPAPGAAPGAAARHAALTAVGDGTRVLGTGAGATLYTVTEGRLVAEAVADGRAGMLQGRPLRDPAGAVCLPIVTADGMPSARSIGGAGGAGGAGDAGVAVAGAGVPRGFDASGAVWTSAAEGAPSGPAFVYTIVRDGKVAGTVTVPGATTRSPIVSDAAGSVWVWTVAGLHHYTADAPPAAGAYTLVRTVFPQTGGAEGAGVLDPVATQVLRTAGPGRLVTMTTLKGFAGSKATLVVMEVK